MARRLAATVLALAAAITMNSCGGADDGDSRSPGTTETSAPIGDY
jgi:hypothetical protein